MKFIEIRQYVFSLRSNIADVNLCVHLSMAADPEGRYNAVLGDGLKETRSSCQTLQPGAASGEEGADHNHPRRWPS